LAASGKPRVAQFAHHLLKPIDKSPLGGIGEPVDTRDSIKRRSQSSESVE
jgi:hypothetical protein